MEVEVVVEAVVGEVVDVGVCDDDDGQPVII